MMNPKLILLSLFLTNAAIAQPMLHDPTEPPGWNLNVTQAIQELKLSEIMINSPHSLAIINGTVVSEGSFIQGYTITQITPDAVYLRNANGSVVIPLVNEAVKSSSN